MIDIELNNKLINKIINDDCINVLKEISNDTFDLIVLDPPYYKTINEEWDKQWKTEEEYLQWTEQYIKECVRTLKPTGSLYIYGNFNMLTKIKVSILDKLLCFRQNITLNKGLRAIAGRTSDKLRMFPTASEYLLFYTKQQLNEINKKIANYLKEEKQKCIKNGISELKLREYCGLSLKGGGALCHYWSESQWRMPTEEHYNKLQLSGYFQKSYNELVKERFTFNLPTGVTDVWDFIPDKVRYEHKTQKPADITERIIKASSNEEDLVFIPFAGSGSEIVKCIELNRNYIACETNKEYIDNIINKRIKELKS